MNWFEIIVKYVKVDAESGKDKKVTEKYLIDAVSFGEAESRMTAEIGNYVAPCELIGVVKSQILDVFAYESA